MKKLACWGILNLISVLHSGHSYIPSYHVAELYMAFWGHLYIFMNWCAPVPLKSLLCVLCMGSVGTGSRKCYREGLCSLVYEFRYWKGMADSSQIVSFFELMLPDWWFWLQFRLMSTALSEGLFSYFAKGLSYLVLKLTCFCFLFCYCRTYFILLLFSLSFSLSYYVYFTFIQKQPMPLNPFKNGPFLFNMFVVEL